jgi:hypothetical protein
MRQRDSSERLTLTNAVVLYHARNLTQILWKSNVKSVSFRDTSCVSLCLQVSIAFTFLQRR